MADHDPHDLLALALRAAEDAGALAARGQAGIAVLDTKSSPTDVVTEMDRAAEELIREVLLGARPGDAILGEEGGAAEGRSGVRWLVDPIDGTVNYLYGRPDWAVSIAAEADGVVVAGVVFAPARGTVYTAVLGEGATRDGSPITAAPRVGLGLALVGTGFGYAAQRRVHQAAVLSEVVPRVRDIRRAGAAALDLCAVADGQLNAYYERGLHPWDWGAGALVAQEAGARVGGLRGLGPNGDLTLAAAPGLFEELHNLLEPLGADRDA
ncbi:inositol monophosphatase family protein [Nocardiopsis ansamitocini]|uniref:Inositol-1-monophosphatase n=1 Tax=Nocardiopsis ansamitocini TaxID=1670832 RepID=A0A9W6P8K9_9ACTN|nr:inositol monophosphatase family protein [Nocardiopsis ansamitocini]GLU49044.1 inositol monophosphatase [Nocardiopsis ansamitocini]